MNSQKNKYLLAVSGGVDSCVLFDIFLKNNYDFIVIHFNHFTRGEENIVEANHVQELCISNNIEFFQFDYKHISGNFQSKARGFRISKYKELIEKYNLKCVVLAHHLDDNFENMRVFKDKYFNLMEKVSFNNGLKIYRPLINSTKKEIYEYARTNKIIYFEDSSNKKDKYIRNYYRIKNYEVDDKLKKNEVNDALKIQKRNKKIRTGNKINRILFEKTDDKKLMLFMFIKKHHPKLNIKNQTVEGIVNAIDFKGNKKFDIGDNIVLVQEYDVIYIKNETKIDKVDNQKLEIGSNNFNGLIFENSIFEGHIRTRKQNDRIPLKKGSKKVSRYMIDEKIPVEIRDIYPVIVNENDEVLYIPKIIKK